jgi:Rrf2 family protein
MFTQTAEYALRAIVFLAQNPLQSQTRQQIAEATKTPSDYLAKVMRALARAGLVRAGRGLHGGFTLSRPSASISLLDVVNVVDPVQRIRTCPLGLDLHRDQLCPVHAKLDQALAVVEQSFCETTIAELLEQPGRVRPLCNALPNLMEARA